MTRKEKIDLLLSKVAEDQKEAFVAELRAAKTPEERLKVAKKYNATLSAEEEQACKNSGTNEVSDDELDKAAGGCCSKCSCYCGCG